LLAQKKNKNLESRIAVFELDLEKVEELEQEKD